MVVVLGFALLIVTGCQHLCDDVTCRWPPYAESDRPIAAFVRLAKAIVMNNTIEVSDCLLCQAMNSTTAYVEAL
jgi:hypothetical protein